MDRDNAMERSKLGNMQGVLDGFQTPEEARIERERRIETLLQEIMQRVVRVESKLSKLLLHQGLDENGFAKSRAPRRPDRRLTD